MPITWSFAARLIPLTPLAVLPIERTSFSSNKMHCPSFVTRIIFLVPSVTLTPISSSSSSSVSALKPFLLILEKSIMLVFFTIPFFVDINNLFSSLRTPLVTGIIALIFSSGIRLRRLITAVPLDVLELSGI